MCLTHSNKGQPDKMFTDPGHDKEEEDFMLYYITCVLCCMYSTTDERLENHRCHHMSLDVAG